jgi:hypothetical protein
VHNAVLFASNLCSSGIYDTHTANEAIVSAS